MLAVCLMVVRVVFNDQRYGYELNFIFAGAHEATELT